MREMRPPRERVTTGYETRVQSAIAVAHEGRQEHKLITDTYTRQMNASVMHTPSRR